MAKVFADEPGERAILEDVARIEVYPDRVELETLFGAQKVVSGRIVKIDFLSSRILLSTRPQVNSHGT